MEYAKSTDIGPSRELNEDALLVWQGPGAFFAAVADGMGGHNAGDVASRMAIETLQEKLGPLETIEFGDLRLACTLANERIFARAGAETLCKGMGTTLVVAAVRPEGMVYIANVGDSRAYYYDSRAGSLLQITRDHSLVQELISSGTLTPEQAKSYPYRNVITRAVGTAPKVGVDLFDVQWRAGDMILLCSDGLSEPVAPAEILKTLETGREIQDMCDELVQKALTAGGTDNVSAILLRCNEPEGGAGA